MPERTEKFFWCYASAMSDLKISRRTLQRWIDDMEIEPMEFEEHLKVFLRLPDMERLREYKLFMATKDQELIKRYKYAVETGNAALIARLRKHLNGLQPRYTDVDTEN